MAGPLPPIRMSAAGPDLQARLDGLPAGPGVYLHKDAGDRVLYVGKAKNLRVRVRQYFRPSPARDPRIARMLARASDLEVIVTDSEVEALILEANLIRRFRPPYNVTLKDDKSYPFIVITRETYPRVFVTRRVVRDGSRYFGPYTDVKHVRAALRAVRSLFKIRSCNEDIDAETIRRGKIRICLDFHIGKCEGPCEGRVSAERYGRMIGQAARLLEGRTGDLMRVVRSEMEEAAAALRFEEASMLRDRLKGLEAYGARQQAVGPDPVNRDVAMAAVQGDRACGVIFRIREGRMVGRRHHYLANVEGRSEEDVISALLQQHYLEEDALPEEILVAALPSDEAALREWLGSRRQGPVSIRIGAGDAEGTLLALARTNARFLLDELNIKRLQRAESVPRSLEALQKDLRLGSLPRRIECFDISTTGGKDTVAALVVFEDGKPRRSEYRHYRIRTVSGVDDFAAMREVVGRRYARVQREGQALPSLVLVDGGKGQLASARAALSSLGLDNLPAAGLAKRLEEVFLPDAPEPLLIARSSPGLRLLQRVRDEAHRFAVAYHRSVRSRRTLQTELDLIRGVGKKRAAELLEAFGSVQGVRFATPEQMAEVVGERVAVRIAERFARSPEEETPP